MGILESIRSPEDVKKLNEADCAKLCEELRLFVVETTAKNGGHLSANLGVVELTVAIHRVFDTSKDRLLFDVGHQSYIHKLLTGRREAFSTLRTFGGLSGFPKPEESVHDAFVAGHASSAISTALGMARARTLLGENYHVLALVGDGALTGGLAYEGLCDAGGSTEPLIVILNDNGMSITKNVGGMARYLSRLRMRRGYITFKKIYRRLMNWLPGGQWLQKRIHNVKQAVKESILPCSMFEDMGFSYLGPVDGHNLKRLESALTIAKEAKGPVLVHVATKKGKGVPYAEENPDDFHGVSSFDPVSGRIPLPAASFSDVFGEELCEIAKRDPRVMAITAAMPMGTGLRKFARRFPNRFFDVGIAEGHAVSMAGGAAHRGMIPVFAVYSTFLQRSYDMLIEDIAISHEHAVLAVDRAGIVGEDGVTHQGIMDVSYLTSIPHMTVWSPASFGELRSMLRHAIEEETGPVAVRYPRGAEGEYTASGAESVKTLREGTDVTLVTYGVTVNTCIEAAEKLEKEGISVELIKLGRIKPLDIDPIRASVAKTGRLLVIEETLEAGGVGERLAAKLASLGEIPQRVKLMNLGDGFLTHGSVSELRKARGLDGEALRKAVRALYGENKT